MAKTKIEWTDWSVNPLRARLKGGAAVGHHCQIISPGCQNCYASNFQKRFGMPKFVASSRALVEPFLDEGRLDEVLRRKKPTRIFWCDMTDMFGDWVPDGAIDRCVAVMAATPQHTHQVLTKRAERAQKYWQGLVDPAARLMRIADPSLTNFTGHRRIAEHWPLKNIWFGVSAENQEYGNERLDWLVQTPAAVRFVSYEPALGPLSILRHLQIRMADLDKPNELNIHWVIAGGESGNGARRSDPDWYRALRDECHGADVAFFFKQWGAWCPGSNGSMVRLPKKLAGRLLDGKEHNEFPTIAG